MPGPDPVSERELARRRLYARGGGDGEAIAAFERLPVPVPIDAAQDLPPTPDEDDRASGAATSPPRRTGRARSVLIAIGVVALVVAIVLTAVNAPPPLPLRVAVPRMPGSTVIATERMRDPSVQPGTVTYQPQGYTLFQPRGRTVAVGLRCVGNGRVHLYAGARFDFRCHDRVQVFRQKAASRRTAPFIVMGTTTGDVVWAARVVLLPSQQVSGAIPSFTDACGTCAVAPG